MIEKKNLSEGMDRLLHTGRVIVFEVELSSYKKGGFLLERKSFKMLNDAFYFILKALFVLKILN